MIYIEISNIREILISFTNSTISISATTQGKPSYVLSNIQRSNLHDHQYIKIC